MAQLMSLPFTVSCVSKIRIGFAFLVPAHLGSPGQRAIKRVCVCVCVCVCLCTWSLAVMSCLITTRSARMRTLVMADNSWRAALTIVVFSPMFLAVSALSNLTFVRDSIREPYKQPPHNTHCHCMQNTC